MGDDRPESRASRLRRRVRDVVSRRPPDGTATCLCGHVRDAHEHYRRGTDCGLCACPRFRS